MKVRVEVDAEHLRRLVLADLREKFGEVAFDASAVVIEVKSKQNYRSEWEAADFRVVVEVLA